jgi:hypothetical protein
VVGACAYAYAYAASIQELAVKGVMGAIKEPIAALTSVSDLLGIRAIRQLEQHPQHKAVFELLQVFSFRKLSDFNDFKAKNGAVLARYGIDEAKAVHDMRLLSLALLASELEQIPYSTVAATLQIQQVA